MEAGGLVLSRNPFERSPELDDACLPNSVAALVAELQSSLRAPRGVSVVVGASRCGKSFVAEVFARRVAGVAEVAVLGEPTSSVAAIARDALSDLDASARDFGADADWITAFRTHVECRSGEGLLTVVVVDDAERLSPQTLEDLAQLFEAATPLRLHLFLFGRGRLLDCMQAGDDSALQPHLLQICRLEPLGVRESVRYLGRRLAMLGNELGRLFDDDAIDEIVQKSGGRLIDLETVAAGALARAQARGRTRASSDDVVMTAPPSEAAEEDEVMAIRQQPLRFRLTDDDDAASSAWRSDAPRETVEWGVDEDDDDDEQWHTDAGDEDDDDDESATTWATGGLDDDDLDVDPGFAVSRKAAAVPSQRRFAGRAVLSVVACLGLIWAANLLPGPADDVPRGRDAQLFAQPLSSEPEQIMRLASTVAAADADAQVVLWREVQADSSTRVAATAATDPVAASAAPSAPTPVVAKSAADAAPAVAKAASNASPVVGTGPAAIAAATTSPSAVLASGEFVGPMLPELMPPAEMPEAPPAMPLEAKAPVPVTRPVVASSPPKSAGVAVAAAAKARAGEVYTVQLGAFRTRSNAEELAGELRGKTTRILREDGLYRVMSGSFASKRDAAMHETSLRRAGYRTYVRTAVF